MGKRTKVEFIESYWKDGNTDYIWNDNHGELIRCKDCKYRYGDKDEPYCSRIDPYMRMYVGDEDFCSWGEKNG